LRKALRERVEQGARGLHVRSCEFLSEPVVDWCQNVLRVAGPALFQACARKTERDPQFPEQGPLLASALYRLEAAHRFRHRFQPVGRKSHSADHNRETPVNGLSRSTGAAVQLPKQVPIPCWNKSYRQIASAAASGNGRRCGYIAQFKKGDDK